MNEIEQLKAEIQEKIARLNVPGMVCYQRQDDTVIKKIATSFGPGDLSCPAWPILALAGLGEGDWTPQFAYWKRPQKMDDGGLEVLD